MMTSGSVKRRLVEHLKTLVPSQNLPTPCSLIYWDRPYVSAIALVALNLLFWLVVLWQWRLFSILSTLGLLYFLYRTWVDDLLPLLFGDAKDHSPHCEGSEGEEGLRQSELSAYFQLVGSSSRQWLSDALACRRDQPLLFCLAGVCTFFALSVLGSVVSGVVLVYILLVLLTIGPGLLLHVIPPSVTHIFFSLMDLPGSSSDDDLKDFIPELSEESLSRQFSLSNQEEEDLLILPCDVPLTPVGENQEGEALEEILSESEEEDFSHGLEFSSQPSSSSPAGFEVISEHDLTS